MDLTSDEDEEEIPSYQPSLREYEEEESSLGIALPQRFSDQEEDLDLPNLNRTNTTISSEDLLLDL